MTNIVAHLSAVVVGPGAGATIFGFILLVAVIYAFLDYPARLTVLHAVTGTTGLHLLIAPGTIVGGLAGAYLDNRWTRVSSGTPRPFLYAVLAASSNTLMAALVLRPFWRMTPSLLMIDVASIALAVFLAKILMGHGLSNRTAGSGIPQR
jgi:hypothetical protein